MFKWNNQGLQDRVPIAAASGWINSLGVPVANEADMKEAISHFLTTGVNGGFDLGNHHDIFQFLPSYKKAVSMENLIANNLFLRHHAIGAAAPIVAAAVNWTDIVYYLQEITIIKSKSNAAVGPVDLPTAFNC